MRTSRLLAVAGLTAVLAAPFTADTPARAEAPDLPCNTAKLIVPWGAGGGTDVIFRTVADAANRLGADPELQVVNVPGQGGNKGAKEARRAKPDGCSLFAMHQSALSSYLTGRVDFHYDAFEPISLMTRTPAIYGAHPSTPYDNVNELVAYAEDNPGAVNVGATLGSTSQFWYLILADKAGVEFNYVPYDGTRERMTALLSNNIDTGEINLAAATKYIASGELKALGITTAERDDRIPDVPTAKEQGYDFVMGTDRGVLAPKGTPDAVVQYYADLLSDVANDSKFQKEMRAKGTLVQYMPPADYEAYLKRTLDEWTRIAKNVGMYER